MNRTHITAPKRVVVCNLKEELRYDRDKDIFLCPGNQLLSPCHYGNSSDNVKID